MLPPTFCANARSDGELPKAASRMRPTSDRFTLTEHLLMRRGERAPDYASRRAACGTESAGCRLMAASGTTARGSTGRVWLPVRSRGGFEGFEEVADGLGTLDRALMERVDVDAR